MNIDPYCQRRNCNPLNALFSDGYFDIAGRSPAMGRQRSVGWGNTLFSRKKCQYHSPDFADGCCITSNKPLSCLQLVFTSNWSNFRHAYASRAAGLSASAGLSCITVLSVYVILINLEAQSFRSLQSVSNPQM